MFCDKYMKMSLSVIVVVILLSDKSHDNWGSHCLDTRKTNFT